MGRGVGVVVKMNRRVAVFRRRSSELASTAASLTSIVVGFVLALVSIPNDVATEGTLAASGVWMCLGLAGGLGAVILARGAGEIFQAESLLVLALVYFLLLDVVQGLYLIPVSEDAVRGAFLAIALFAGGCSLARVCPRPPLPRVVRASMATEYSEAGLLGLMLAFFVLGMFRFAWTSGFSVPVMLEGLEAPRFAAPWSRGGLGGWDALTDVLVNFGYPLVTFTVMLVLHRGQWFDWKVGLGIVLSSTFLLFIAQGGARRIVGTIVGAGLLTWVCGNRHRLGVTKLLAVGATFIALLITLHLILETRTSGWAEYAYESPGSATISVDDNFLRLAQTIEAVPKDHPHIGGQWIWYLLVRPIPRIMWAKKPENPGFSLPDYLGLHGVSLSTAVIGEWYLAFGWGGVATGGLLFGLMARTWSRVLEEGKTVKSLGIYGFGVMGLCLGIRSMVEVILLCYPLVFWIFADRLVRPRQIVGRRAVVDRTPPVTS